MSAAEGIATAREALASGVARKTGTTIYAERGPEGLRDVESGRYLREIIPAGYSFTGNVMTSAGPVRILRYEHHANASAPVWVVVR